MLEEEEERIRHWSIVGVLSRVKGRPRAARKEESQLGQIKPRPAIGHIHSSNAAKDEDPTNRPCDVGGCYLCVHVAIAAHIQYAD